MVLPLPVGAPIKTSSSVLYNELKTIKVINNNSDIVYRYESIKYKQGFPQEMLSEQNSVLHTNVSQKVLQYNVCR